jgi:outer membrane protein assembly factor BamB
MARRSGSWWAVMLGLTALVAGCGDLPPEGVSSPEAIESGDELEGEPDQWWLVDATPDRQLLELTTRGGGCSEFAGWVSETNDDRVRVEARWEHAEADDCPAVLRTDTLVLDLDEPLGDRDLVGCRHDDCLAPPDEGDEHPAFAASIEAVGPGAVVSSVEDVWSVEPDGQVAWRVPLGGGWIRAVGDLVVRYDHNDRIEALSPGSGEVVWQQHDVTLAGVAGDTLVVCSREQVGQAGERERFLGGLDATDGDWRWRLDGQSCTTDGVGGDDAAFARVEFDGEGTWLEVYDTATGEERHRIRVAEPEAAIGPPTWLGGGRVVLGQQHPDRFWVVDLAGGEIDELAAAGGRIEGVVDGVVVVEGETQTFGIDVEADAVLWAVPRTRAGERIVVGDGALVVFDGDAGSITLLDPQRGDVRWDAEVGSTGGMNVVAVNDRLLATTSTTLFAFDLSSGEPAGWTALVPERAQTANGTHPPQAGKTAAGRPTAGILGRVECRHRLYRPTDTTHA